MFEAKIIAIFDRNTKNPRFFIQVPRENKPQMAIPPSDFIPQFQSRVFVTPRNEEDKIPFEILSKQQADTPSL